jgi:hypothetical protein
MDFSIILQNSDVRAVVQENLLERAFHDALFPGSMFRGEAEPILWPAHSGDTQIFTGAGLIKPKMKPLAPGVDPQPSSYATEQWESTLQQYSDSIDSHMPTSMVAIIDLFMRNAHQLGLSAAQSLNRIVRDRMYNAALSGWTVADGAQAGPTTSLVVKRLNGFTRARRPGVAGASGVRFEQVSSSNPLPITVQTGSSATVNVIGYTPVTPGDEVGPGTLLLDAAVSAVPDRGYVYTYDRTEITRVGGGLKVDEISNTDILTLAACRSAITSFRKNNVPTHQDMRYHAHIDPVVEGQIFGDTEFQRLNVSLPDYVIYRDFALGEILGTVFFRNTECPTVETVEGGLTATYSQDDPFAGELYNTGVAATATARINRVLLTAQGGIKEYYSDLNELITEAGVTGKVAEPRIVNNGIEINADRVQLIIRGPLNRLQDVVSTSWKFIGDWPTRTDSATGSTARYKRFHTIECGVPVS